MSQPAKPIVRTAAPPATDGTPRLILEEGLRQWLGRPVRVTALEATPLDAQSTYPIDRLLVALDSGEQLPVIFKRLQAGEGPKGNRREVLVYQRLLAGCRFGAPALYASLYEEGQGHYWLFLEDLGEQTLKSADWDDWAAAVRLLAQMHGTYLGREEGLRALNCLGEQGTDYYLGIARTARGCLDLAGDRRGLARFDALMTRFADVADHLVRQPRTMVHGDIFSNNLLLQPDGRVRLIDWESAAVGLGAGDLARLIDGWGSDKAAFIAVYLDTLEQVSGVTVDRAEFARTFTACEILNCLWHLGWEADDCRDPEFGDWLLTEMETIWRRLDGEGAP